MPGGIPVHLTGLCSVHLPHLPPKGWLHHHRRSGKVCVELNVVKDCLTAPAGRLHVHPRILDVPWLTVPEVR